MPARKGSPLLERVLIGIALLVVGWTAARIFSASTVHELAWFATDGRAELAPLAAKYGPHHFSRNVEEWLIRDYYDDKRDGVFVDVGANHYRDENNTYF